MILLWPYNVGALWCGMLRSPLMVLNCDTIHTADAEIYLNVNIIRYDSIQQRIILIENISNIFLTCNFVKSAVEMQLWKLFFIWHAKNWFCTENLTDCQNDFVGCRWYYTLPLPYRCSDRKRHVLIQFDWSNFKL